MSTKAHSNDDFTRMTIDFPVGKHKRLKAIAALLGVSMKEFVLVCVMEKLDNQKTLKVLEEQRDTEAFDRGLKSIREEGYDTLEDVKRFLRSD